MNRIAKAGTIAVFSLSLASGLYAQSADSHVRVGDKELNTHVGASSTTDPNMHKAVMKSNKASDLLGMKVINNQNENLGDIKDLVVDLPSGRISYAVLSVGGFLGVGEKYVAVPPSAFKINDTHDKLVLNADKAKIEQAPGFVKTDWPALNHPTLYSYWGIPNEENATGRPGIDVQTGTDVKPNPQFDKNLNRDLNNPDNRRLDKNQSK